MNKNRKTEYKKRKTVLNSVSLIILLLLLAVVPCYAQSAIEDDIRAEAMAGSSGLSEIERDISAAPGLYDLPDSKRSTGIVSGAKNVFGKVEWVANLMSKAVNWVSFWSFFRGKPLKPSSASMMVSTILFIAVGLLSGGLFFLIKKGPTILASSVVVVLAVMGGQFYLSHLIFVGLIMLYMSKKNFLMDIIGRLLGKKSLKNKNNENANAKAKGGAKAILDRINFSLKQGGGVKGFAKNIFVSEEQRKKIEKIINVLTEWKETAPLEIQSLADKLETFEHLEAKGIATDEDRQILLSLREDLIEEIHVQQGIAVEESRKISNWLSAIYQRGIKI